MSRQHTVRRDSEDALTLYGYSRGEPSMDKLDTILDLDTEDHLGRRVAYQVPVTAYPTDSNVIIVNSPGSGEFKDGRGDRWMKLGRHLQERNMAAMVTYNAPRPAGLVQLEWEPYSYQGVGWNQLLVESLAHAVDWSLEHSVELCGTETPSLYLAGFSSGGSAVGAVAFRYPMVRGILLLSTYDSVGDWFYDGVTQFTGDIHLVYGNRDPIAGFLAYVLQSGPMAAASFQVREVPDCDHRFSGEANTLALTDAFYWALPNAGKIPGIGEAPKRQS